MAMNWIPDYYYDEVTGATDANGYAYLEIYIPAMFLEGLDFMHARMIDPDYAELSSENTTTQTMRTIWPGYCGCLIKNQFQRKSLPITKIF